MIVAVDFDGTCVDHKYPEIGAEVPYAALVLKTISQTGCDLILWTMRSGKQLEDAVQWFEDRDIPLYGINKNPDQDWSDSPKAYAHRYIDDAALGVPLIQLESFARPCVDWTVIANKYFNFSWEDVVES